MAKQLTAPGCTYTIVARVDTTIYSPDQKWTLDVPAGQYDFIAETNEIIIPGDAMMCRKTHRVSKDLARVNLLGKGSGSLATFVARSIEQIVGKGNVKVEYGDGKLTVGLNSSVTAAQIAVVENLLEYVLPKDVVLEIDPSAFGFRMMEYLEGTGSSYIHIPLKDEPEDDLEVETYGAFVDITKGVEGKTGGSTTSFFWGISGNRLYAGSGNFKTSSLNPDTDWHTFVLRKSTSQNGEFIVDGNRLLSFAPANISLLQGVGYGLWRLSNNSIYAIQASKKSHVIIRKNDKVVYHLVSALDSAGVPCMLDLMSSQPFYNSGTGLFIVGMTIEQALNLSKLPVTADGTLTVSLPWEAQWDTGVQNALSVAATKGWTITVQYRDPEVTTENIPISFLESTGTQCALLPFAGNLSNIEFEMDAQFAATGQRQLMGYSNTAWLEVDAGGNFMINAPRSSAGSALARSVVTYSMEWLSEGRKEKITASRTVTSPLITFGFQKQNGWMLCGLIYQTNGRPSFFCRAKIWSAKLKLNNTLFDIVTAIDSTGKPCFVDKKSKTPFYNYQTGADFIAGFDTVEQARNLAYLPDVTAETDAAKKSLTVSLPWEAQLVITGVPAALQVAADRGWTITVQYRDPEADNAYYNKYAACTTNEEMAAINPDYRNDVTVDGVWEWNLPNMVNFVVPYGGDYFTAGVATAKQIKHLKLNLPKATGDMWSGVRSIRGVIETIELNAPLVTGLNGTFYDALAKKYTLNVPKVASVNALLGWCPNARELHGNFDSLQTATNWFSNYSTYPPFTTVTCGFPALSRGAGMFSGVQLNKDSALLVLGSIPTWTDGASHTLTIGIHVDHQADEDVVNAIAEAEAKGWTLTVQWNGKATAQAASTFGLRRNPVYAKPGKPMEDGTPILDWGHYVTDWEQNGYLEFSSLEEAEEYFNINQPEEV